MGPLAKILIAVVILLLMYYAFVFYEFRGLFLDHIFGAGGHRNGNTPSSTS